MIGNVQELTLRLVTGCGLLIGNVQELTLRLVTGCGMYK